MRYLLTHEVLEGRASDGGPVVAPVVNEHVVRAAAGTTMALGAVAFAYAYFEHSYWGLQVVSSFFFVEFLVRVSAGISRSPVGLAAGWMTRRQPPDWVSAKPKRFAWSLGLAMAGAMTVITNVGIRGWLPRSICLICLTLMWLESAVGLCLGCEIHGQLVRRGWARQDEAFEICAHGACDVAPARRPGRVARRTP
ncbi:MAG: DUF4395 domain-containing protein [Nocardioides sp.]